MHRDAPRCTEYHRVGCMYFECTELHQAILLILICTVMHRDAPRCTMMHRVLLSYYILYYLYLGKVIAIMRFCFSVHHGASRCITVHFSRYQKEEQKNFFTLLKKSFLVPFYSKCIKKLSNFH